MAIRSSDDRLFERVAAAAWPYATVNFDAEIFDKAKAVFDAEMAELRDRVGQIGEYG